MRPSLLTKYVCSPNTSLSCGTIGWSSGMGSASNWPSVCSICVDVSFIPLSPFGWIRRRHRQAEDVQPSCVQLTFVLAARSTPNVRCSHTPSRDDGAFGVTPSASRKPRREGQRGFWLGVWERGVHRSCAHGVGNFRTHPRLRSCWTDRDPITENGMQTPATHSRGFFILAVNGEGGGNNCP